MQNEVLHGHFPVCLGPRVPTCFHHQRREVHKPQWIIPSPVLCALLHLTLLEYPSVPGTGWGQRGNWTGPRFQGSQTSWENDPGAGARPRHRAQLDGENPGRGEVTGKPVVRMASDEGGNRQEPDPETPGQRLGTLLRREGPLEALTGSDMTRPEFCKDHSGCTMDCGLEGTRCGPGCHPCSPGWWGQRGVD